MSIIYYPTQPIPGGIDRSVQFNLQGAFGGDSALTYNYNLQTLSVGGPALFKATVSFLANLLDGTGSTGTNGQVLSSTGTATKWITPGGGGGSPAGSDTQIQFNQSGSFGADANLLWDYNAQQLSVAGTFTVSAGSYELSDNADTISSVINNSTPAATTQWSTANASALLGASGLGAVLNLGAASGPTFQIQCSEFGLFALATGSIKFLNSVILGGALEDGSNSPGSAGNVLTSTGTATAWTDSPVLSALTLSAATPTVTSGQIGFGTTTDTAATAGSNGDVPSQVVGYLVVNLGGTAVKIPYYAS